MLVKRRAASIVTPPPTTRTTVRSTKSSSDVPASTISSTADHATKRVRVILLRWWRTPSSASNGSGKTSSKLRCCDSEWPSMYGDRPKTSAPKVEAHGFDVSSWQRRYAAAVASGTAASISTL